MAKQVGITGGIGSGKTTVCKLFETLGIPVYYADYRAKKLMTDSAELAHQIKELIGSDAYFKDGSLIVLKISAPKVVQSTVRYI